MKHSGPHAGLTIILAGLLAACSGDDTNASASATDGTGSTTSDATGSAGATSATGTSSTTSGTTATGTTTTATDSGSTGSGAGNTGTGDTAGSGSGTTGSGSESTGGSTGSTGTTGGVMVSLAITNLMIFQDCMPVVAADPMGASWTLEVTNDGASSVSGTIDSARLLDVNAQQLGTVGFSPLAIPSVNPTQTVPINMTKTANTLNPANGCGTAPCNTSVTLELDVTVGGQPQSVEASTNVDCVY